ncbi:conserved hypothetical protein [Ricinus communis]|uniref:Uncharacterized protein n=1 Tax=Ricinus communis TaxID=3988 RepID=B9TIE2_RICCO|nr:conserved hypothetical protein [Ricinus communis]
MTVTRFVTVKEAANAIADEMNIANDEDRAYAARCHAAALVDAIGSNAIVYRDRISRLPIRRDGILAVLVAQSCVISIDDLNAWLESMGVGVQVRSITLEPNEPGSSKTQLDNERPTSAELATTLGPYLSADRDSEWLRKRLNDADRYPRLQKYRVMEGSRPVAHWEVGGVVLHLIESGDMARKHARDVLTERYPLHLYVLDGLDMQEPKSPSTWFPAGG